MNTPPKNRQNEYPKQGGHLLRNVNSIKDDKGG